MVVGVFPGLISETTGQEQFKKHMPLAHWQVVHLGIYLFQNKKLRGFVSEAHHDVVPRMIQGITPAII